MTSSKLPVLGEGRGKAALKGTYCYSASYSEASLDITEALSSRKYPDFKDYQRHLHEPFPQNSTGVECNILTHELGLLHGFHEVCNLPCW